MARLYHASDPMSREMVKTLSSLGSTNAPLKKES
jgi:hypothetical protein